ncbi:hypothetical protein [Streptomyces sp. NBC_01578]|uniref:hypothetical protein n=1 Tax=Streptomyces sp. NBC_01578 TaxID=2975884 RepID=UPI00386A01A5
MAQGHIRRAERIVPCPHCGLPGILGIGLIAEMLGLVREGELVGDRPEADAPRQRVAQQERCR